MKPFSLDHGGVEVSAFSPVALSFEAEDLRVFGWRRAGYVLFPANFIFYFYFDPQHEA